jgi:hypothetical protein
MSPRYEGKPKDLRASARVPRLGAATRSPAWPPVRLRTSDLCAAAGLAAPLTRRPILVDMQVIVRRQDQKLCASITCMIRHYVARRAKVIFDHPHNAESSALLCRMIMLGGAYPCTAS